MATNTEYDLDVTENRISYYFYDRELFLKTLAQLVTLFPL